MIIRVRKTGWELICVERIWFTDSEASSKAGLEADIYVNSPMLIQCFIDENARNHGFWGESGLRAGGAGFGLLTGKALMARLMPGRVSSRYLTTAETEVSRWAAQTRARRYESSGMATVMLRMESLQRSEIRGQRSGVRDQFKRRSPDFLYCATTEGNYRQPPAVGPIARYSLAQGVSRVSKPRHEPPSFVSQTWATRPLIAIGPR